MNKPFFSVVIPTFNRADYILNTLKTIFAQTFTDYEVIVVDNCSTDNTVELLRPLVAEGKIKLIVNPNNLERSYNRNVGLENASGQYLTLLDSDDFMYPSCLKDAHDYINTHSGTKFFHNRYHLVNKQGKVLYNFWAPNVKNVHKSICWGNFLSCIGVFMHRDIYLQYRFDTNPLILGSEDWDFWIRILAKYPLGRINKINSAILHHDNRTITQLSIDSVITRKQVIVAKIKADKELFDVYEKYIHEINTSSDLYAASMASSSGNFELAKKFIFKAFKENPKTIFSLKFLRIAQIAYFRISNKYSL